MFGDLHFSVTRFSVSRFSVARSMTGALLTLTATICIAQQIPNVGDALRQAAPPPVPVAPQRALPPIGGEAQPVEPPMQALPSGPKLEVKAIQVIGNRVIATSTLAALVTDDVGKMLTLGDLETVAQKITRYYRAHGYFVARAYVPAQEITAGLIRIRVVEGNYGAFRLKNTSRVRDSVVQGMLDNVKGANIVSVDTLERAMLIINDTPGVQVTRADVMPGEQVGTSDFAVDTVGTAAFTGYVMFDNYGSVYTGKERLSFDVDANSPTGSGDRVSLSGLTSENGDLLNGRLAYSAPLASNGLRGEVAVSQTAYRLTDSYSPLDATGHAAGVDAILSYPIRRTEAQSLNASLDFAYKNLNDVIGATDTRTPRDTLAATAALNFRDDDALFALDGRTQATGAVTIGHLNFKDGAAESLDSAGASTAGTYSKLDASLSRISMLPARLSLTTSVNGQVALDHKTLDGTERMAVSGATAVSAYPPDELIGDSALFVHADLDERLATVGTFHSDALLFTDYGEAWENYGAGPIPERRDIEDVGLGFNAALQGLILHATLSHRLHAQAPLSEPYSRDKLLVQLGWVF
jgi:hemolysin activation/secretion protein